MSIGISIFALTGVVLARKNLGNNALALATKLAVIMMTAGGLLGFAMTRTMAGQSSGGDLRVAHFLGLHSLHVIPLAALLVMGLARRQTVNLNDKGQRRVVALTAVAYAGVVATSFAQALRSIPVTAPDTNTWTTFVLLSVTPALAAILVAIRPR